MKTKEKNTFLFIDGFKTLLSEFGKLIQNIDNEDDYVILVHGETGCGKLTFCKKCLSIIEKEDSIIKIDLSDELHASNLDSTGKLKSLLQIIEYELIKQPHFGKLEEKYKDPEMFKWILKDLLNQTNSKLLVLFPRVETYADLEKYYYYLNIKNVIPCFITDKQAIVEKCKGTNDLIIKYFECKPLKKGDGQLYIENMFSDKDPPVFDINDIESLMEIKAHGSEMTISQLIGLCEPAYKYAKLRQIELITKSVILESLVASNVV